MAQTPSTTYANDKSAIAPTATVSNKVRRMLGLSLHGWENVMVVFLIVAGLFALVAGAATWAVVRLQRIELAESKDALERYKIDAAKQLGKEVASVRSDADAKIGIAREEAKAVGDKAAADIAKANAEIETARRDAENARLEQERLKTQLAWRTIRPEQLQTLRTVLANARGTVFIEYAQNDPEAASFAAQLTQAFSNDPSRWRVGAGMVSYPTYAVFGLAIRGRDDNATLGLIRKAFTDAGVGFGTDPPPNVSTINRSGGAPQGNEDAVIAIGSKRPPVL